MTDETKPPEKRPPVIEIDDVQVLHDQVAALTAQLGEAMQLVTRHQAIARQLANQLTAARAELEAMKPTSTT